MVNIPITNVAIEHWPHLFVPLCSITYTSGCLLISVMYVFVFHERVLGIVYICSCDLAHANLSVLLAVKVILQSTQSHILFKEMLSI